LLPVNESQPIARVFQLIITQKLDAAEGADRRAIWIVRDGKALEVQ
jgi:hypothetical protein